MKIQLSKVALAFLILFTMSCTHEPVAPPTEFKDGAYILNEGSFGASNASICYLNADGTITNNIFSTQNDGLILGDILQDMVIHNGKAYLSVNNSNKIWVADAKNLKVETSITVNQPRYLHIHNDELFVSQWTSFATNCIVSRYNLSTNSLIDTFVVGKLPEQMIGVGNNLVIGNQGDTTVHVYNLTTNTLSNFGNVENPRFIKKTADGNIWILYQGDFGFFGPATPGGFIVLNSTASAIVKTIPFTITGNPSQLAVKGNDLFYILNNQLYKINASATTEPAGPVNPLTYTNAYGIQTNAASVYVLNASFTGNSTLYQLDDNGSFQDSLSIQGLGSNALIFN